MDISKELSTYIHLSKYSRWIDELGRRETWRETVDRYTNFWTERFEKRAFSEPGHKEELMRAIQQVGEQIYNVNVMPSMRTLMTAGKALTRDEISGYNCTASAVTHPAIFSEAFYILMSGCFDKDTEVKTKSGDKKISEITLDDEILSFNEDTGKYEWKKPFMVMESIDSDKKDKIELEFEDGSIERCTVDHEYFTTNRGYVRADELTEDDDIQNFHEISS